jgi:hypothetical protein
MVTLALGGGKRGGKLLLLCPTIWDIIAVYLHTETLTRAGGVCLHNLLFKVAPLRS